MNQAVFSFPQLTVEIASNPADILASQQLRYQIFALEQGAQLESAKEETDQDYYDHFCHHLILKDRRSNQVVGSTRILTEASAQNAGSFYSENEFALQTILPLPGKVIEIGRTCIHPDYRNGSGIAVLWLGLARFMEIHQIDYLFGCSSVSMRDGGEQIANIMHYIHDKDYMAPDAFRVTPHNPLESSLLKSNPLEKIPPENEASLSRLVTAKPILPPLLKAYISLGAWIAGEPSFDEAFNVADLFVLLDVNRLNKRYQKRFMSSVDVVFPDNEWAA